MNGKHLIIVSLLLAILTMCAVSASDDVSGNLTVEGEIDDSTLAVDDSNLKETDDSTLAVDDSNSEETDDSLGETDQEVIGTIRVGIATNINLDDDIISFESDDTSQTGTLIVYVNGDQCYSRNIVLSDYSQQQKFTLKLKPYDLGIKFPTKDSTIDLEVKLDGVSLARQSNVNINPFTFYFEDEDGYDLDDGYYGYGNPINLKVYVPSDATGRFEIRILKGGNLIKTYAAVPTNGVATVNIDAKGWDLADYDVEGKYIPLTNNRDRYSSQVVYDSFSIRADIDAPSIMSEHEREELKISASPSLSGTATLIVEKHDERTGNWWEMSQNDLVISKGYSSYSLSYLDEGEYRLTIDYTLGVFIGQRILGVSVYKNTPGISSSISPTTITQGEIVWVKLNGPKLYNINAYIYDNDRFVKGVILSSGKVEEALLNLPVGTHKINIYLNGDENGLEYFHSNTQFVTVKAKSVAPAPAPIKLTLNKAKIKRSKKLVLSATLKQGNVALKGKKITFKFKGKTYKAKTNAKGVAKVTIKKSVLKKLKVGKKVTVKAIYGSLTSKFTAKVSK